MRRMLIATVLCGALAACGNPAEDSDEPMMAETTAAATGESWAGTYDVTNAQGTRFTATLNPDGTYEDTAADGSLMVRGTWEDKDGKACFDAEGDGPVICYTVGEPAADGTMVATPDDGSSPLTITKTR